MKKFIRCEGKLYLVELHLSGWWSTWNDSFGGYLKADSLDGLKKLISFYGDRDVYSK